MIGNITQHILGLHGWAALALIFGLPALESSAFVGFVVPGEIAVLLGGVLAYQHRVSLPAALAAGIAGAVLGDSIGYAVGRRYGRGLLHGSIGRFVKPEHLDRAERYLADRGGRAVFVGRFTAALRVLVPGLAGMARMPYRSFAAYNIAGGAVWVTENVLLGYLAGSSWHRVARVASRVGLVLLGLLVLALALSLLLRVARRRSDRLRAVGDRLAAAPPAGWVRRRLPRQVAWLRRRLDPSSPAGFALTFTLVAGALCVWAFVGLTQDVLANEEAVRLDPAVQAFAVGHRTGWLTTIMQTVTWLGSTAVLIPLLLAVSVLAVRRRWDRRLVAYPWVAFAGSFALHHLAKPLIDRRRPPAAGRRTDRARHRAGLPVRPRHTGDRYLGHARAARQQPALCSTPGRARRPGGVRRPAGRRLPHLPRYALVHRRARWLRPRRDLARSGARGWAAQPAHPAHPSRSLAR